LLFVILEQVFALVKTLSLASEGGEWGGGCSLKKTNLKEDCCVKKNSHVVLLHYIQGYAHKHWLRSSLNYMYKSAFTIRFY
jgi:hypothetical protein